MQRQYSTTRLDPRTENLVGHPPFGGWTVIAFAYYRDNSAYWLCRCICGTTKPIKASNLTRQLSKSCGCLKSELLAKASTTHGRSHTPEHNTWCKMISRCYDPRDPSYPRWGGRGITVCPQWLTSFAQFYEDMGAKPTPKHTIERIDNDQGYSPQNCKWATIAEQNRNQRSNVMKTFQGRTQCVSEWAHEFGFKPHTLAKRLHSGLSLEEALTKPRHYKPVGYKTSRNG